MTRIDILKTFAFKYMGLFDRMEVSNVSNG